MIRRSRSMLPVALLGAVLLVGWFVPPSGAHDSPNVRHNWRKHYAPLAKKAFYTKRLSNARFINVGEQASDSALLDGLGASDFAAASHAHAGADITSGTVDASVIDAAIARVADVFSIVLGSDGSGSTLDADLLDGLHSTAFQLASSAHAVQWFKDTADSLGATATSEQVVFTAPADITITDVFVEPAAALTASDTNYATITVARRDATGGNKVTVASRSTQTSASGGTGDWTAFGTVSLGSLSNTALTDGKKLTIEVTKTGLGVVLPILAVQIEYTVN